MAVQAQFPSNGCFSPDFRTSARAANVLDGLHMLQARENEIGNLLHSLWRPAALTGDVMQRTNVLSDNPSSASRSRKRCRKYPVSHMPPPVFQQPAVPNSSVAQSSNVFECAAPSSSGQPAGVSPGVLLPFYQHNHELDALLCIQNERLRQAMLDAHKRYCIGLLSAHGQHVVKRLSEKEAELQNASRRNAELEKQLCQIRAETLILFNLAKNNEAIVASLRTSLEQVKVQNTAAAVASAEAMEGYGDNEGTPLPATDALRCAIECKVCWGNEASVLVLPCRHLCLCKACDSATGSCPICGNTKDDSLHVFFS